MISCLWICIDAELEDLIPELFQEIRETLEKMAAALEKEDFQTLEILGHGFKGACGSYGLEDLAEIFLAIETGAKNRVPGIVAEEAERVVDYLEQVDIEYVGGH